MSVKRVLYPVDLSPQSLSGLEFATQLAKQNEAKLCFVYVASPPIPEETMFGSDFERGYLETLKRNFDELRPADQSVEYEHVFLRGNAGPKIAAETKTADLCVLTTHGRSALMRILLGSVAQYVLRHAKCPVVMLKGFVEVETQGPLAKETKHYVTEAMRQVAPIHAYDKIEEVLVELNKAGDTGAPVINALGMCIGILTTTDIERYQELLARYEAHDETVVSEMFGTDKYGLVRSGTHEFPQVKAHMTEDVIAVNVSDTIQTAIDVFDANPEIHHLVVVDEEGGPVGILDSEQIVRCGGEMLDGESAQNTEESTVAQS